MMKPFICLSIFLLLLSCDKTADAVVPVAPFRSLCITLDEPFSDAYNRMLAYGGSDYTGATSVGGRFFFLFSKDFIRARYQYISRYIDLPNGILVDLNGISGRVDGCCASFLTGRDGSVAGYGLNGMTVHDSRMKRVRKGSLRYPVTALYMDTYGAVHIDFREGRFVYTGMPVDTAIGLLNRSGFVPSPLKVDAFRKIMANVGERRELPFYPPKNRLSHDCSSWKEFTGSKGRTVLIDSAVNPYGNALVNGLVVVGDTRTDEYEVVKLPDW